MLFKHGISDIAITLSPYILCFPLKSSSGAELNSGQGRPGYISRSKMESGLAQVIGRYLYLFSTMSIVYFFALSVIQRMAIEESRRMERKVWLLFCLSRKSSLNKESGNMINPKAVCFRNYEWMVQSLHTDL